MPITRPQPRTAAPATAPLAYGSILLLGSAFFGVQALFAIYNAYVPIFLQSGRPDFVAPSTVHGGFGLGATLTGFVLSLDNLVAIVLLPVVGVLSDATSTPLGKRKPFILVGAPLTALAFAAIPWQLGHPLWRFLAVTAVMIVAIAGIRTPLAALMPDITPPALRSQANGIINLLGGAGALVAFAAGGALYRWSPAAPFVFAAALLLAGCLAVVALLPVPVEPRQVTGAPRSWPLRARAGKPLDRLAPMLRALGADRNRSVRLLLAMVFCVFVSYSALVVYFTSFAAVTLRVARGHEGRLLADFALAVMLFAVPAGFGSAKLGRKRAMLLGLGSFGAAMAPMSWIGSLPQVRVCLMVAGVAWAVIAANALPMVLDSLPAGGVQRIGTYTGLFFLATQAAEVIGPVLIGGMLDLTGHAYRLLFVVTPIAMVVAGALLLGVRDGEPRDAVPPQPEDMDMPRGEQPVDGR